MNPGLLRRLSAITGLALAAAVALWWLGSTRLALDDGADAGRAASAALQALWLLRATAVALVGLRVGAGRSPWAGSVELAALVAPAWPVVVLAWSASEADAWRLAGAEALLLAGCAGLPPLGRGLRRLVSGDGAAELVATLGGVVLAAALWWSRGAWQSLTG